MASSALLNYFPHPPRITNLFRPLSVQLLLTTSPNTICALIMAPGVPVDAFTGKVSTPINGYSKRAYVTFLAGNGDYVKGVVGLTKGLRKVKSAYPLVVAILPDVPEEHRQILRSQGCIVREIQPIHPPENQIQFAMAYYVINYSKLRIWNVRKWKSRALCIQTHTHTHIHMGLCHYGDAWVSRKRGHLNIGF